MGAGSASESKGFHHKPAEWLESSCLSLRLVEWGFALLNARAQHWRNMVGGFPLSLCRSDRLSSAPSTMLRRVRRTGVSDDGLRTMRGASSAGAEGLGGARYARWVAIANQSAIGRAELRSRARSYSLETRVGPAEVCQGQGNTRGQRTHVMPPFNGRNSASAASRTTSLTGTSAKRGKRMRSGCC